MHWRLAFIASAAVAVALAVFTARTSGAPTARRERPSMRSLATRRLGLLCLAAFLGYATVAGVGYMVSFYARDRMGLGPLERGVVLACFGAAGFVLGRPLGAAVQRIGRIPSVIIGAVFSAACVAPLGFSTSAWQLAALWTLAGAGSVLLWTGLNTLALEAVPENRGGATSVFGAFRFAGSALSPVRLPAPLQRRALARVRGLRAGCEHDRTHRHRDPHVRCRARGPTVSFRAMNRFQES